MNLQQVLSLSINENLIRMILSKPAKDAFSTKMKVRPILIKKQLLFQVTETVGSRENNTLKEVHKNLNSEELKKKILELVPGCFGQVLIETNEGGYTVLANKKGTVTVIKNAAVNAKQESLSHNREKKYLLSEGTPISFLVDLGVMTNDGKIVRKMYDKFRQINRYLEFVEDIVENLPTDREISIIDFGCGKSYLTFALYYYLFTIRKMNIKIIGLDLKSDVIKECNRLKNKYKFEKLKFIEGDIEHFDEVDSVDMVISLHACDTATDYAIYKAVKWDAKVILAVPCCQHELNKAIDNRNLYSITQYGILKDRLCAIITDAQRANLLKLNGYETQILEFIDMEHTPKNLLIRAVKSGKMQKPSDKEMEASLEQLAGVDLTLKKLFGET